MSCTDNTKPIAGSSATITLTTAPDSIDNLGLTIHPSATLIMISFDLSPSGQGNVLGRMSRDAGFALTDVNGEPIIQASKKALTLEQFGALFRSITGTIDAFAEQFQPE